MVQKFVYPIDFFMGHEVKVGLFGKAEPYCVETHQVTTNSFGLASLQIGAGAVVSRTFESVPWCRGTLFLKTDTDLSGVQTIRFPG
jgi:hypothetical protein